MRFVDSNVFLHAFLIPQRTLRVDEQQVKDRAKSIIERIEASEEVVMTTVHLSEVVNIIESGLGLERSLGFLAWVITMENVAVHSTSMEDYKTAIVTARDYNISANDALAYTVMKDHGLEEIYSFDKHFDQLRKITRLTSP